MNQKKALFFGIAPAVFSLLLQRSSSALGLTQGMLRAPVIVLSTLLPLLLFLRYTDHTTLPRPVGRFSPLPFFLCLTGLLLSDFLFGLFLPPLEAQHPNAADYLCSFLLTPIFEEMLYRGFVLPTLLPLSAPAAILLSSLLFGASHSSSLAILHAALCGTMLALLTLKTKALLPAVFAHAIYNLLALLSASDGFSKSVSYFATTLILLLGALSGIFLCFDAFSKRKSAKREKRG